MTKPENDRLLDPKGDFNRTGSLFRLFAGVILFVWTSASADAAEIKIGYLHGTKPKPSLSLIQIPADNDGVAGARLAIHDNNTTGKFLDQQFSLDEMRLAEDDDAAAAARSMAERGISFLIADVPTD